MTLSQMNLASLKKFWSVGWGTPGAPKSATVRVHCLFGCFVSCVILRFTSAATCADCTEVSMPAKPF